jgi:magnesium transporter
MIAENIVLSSQLTWTDIETPHPGDVPFLTTEFDLPPMLVTDSQRPGHLPKFEQNKDVSFFLLRFYDNKKWKNDISTQHATSKLAIFIQGEKVVTVHLKVLMPIRKFSEQRKLPEFPQNPRDLVYQIFRLCVSSYDEAILHLQADYETFERLVLAHEPGTLSNTMVYEFRRKLYILRGIIQLMQQALYHSRVFWGEQSTLQQDLKEGLDQVLFKLDSLGQNFDQLFSLYLSINEQRNNDVMKVLTVFASIMLPLTFIASFYGMNFEYIPGLHTTTGFVGAILIMITTTFITIWYFSRKKWFKLSM